MSKLKPTAREVIIGNMEHLQQGLIPVQAGGVRLS